MCACVCGLGAPRTEVLVVTLAGGRWYTSVLRKLLPSQLRPQTMSSFLCLISPHWKEDLAGYRGLRGPAHLSRWPNPCLSDPRHWGPQDAAGGAPGFLCSPTHLLPALAAGSFPHYSCDSLWSPSETHLKCHLTGEFSFALRPLTWAFHLHSASTV